MESPVAPLRLTQIGRRCGLAFAALACWLTLPSHAAPDSGDSACTSLAALDLSEAVDAEVTFSEVAHTPARGDQPELCRIAGSIAPAVGFEVRMPVAGWNGRLLVTGCTNLCGILQIQGMEDALARGYAAATSDLGHRTGDPAIADWAHDAPDAEIDYGHRATHVTTLAARELIANYYGEEPAYAYFRGCSTGGRQALVAAERYPDDFDGIIAGAPFNPALSVPHMAWAMQANTAAGGKPILGRREFNLLARSALDACDGHDGVEDGVIADPPSCAFRPESLLCTGNAAQDCLTPSQVEAARKIYAGPRNSRGQPFLSARSPSAGAAIGSEATWAGSLLPVDGRTPFFQFVVGSWSQYLAYEPDPPLGEAPSDFNFDRGPAQIAVSVARSGFRPELGRFHALGGRLIVYHGWSDESIMPAHTLDYWHEAGERLGPARLAETGRLFMVPGMLHCGGGPGATAIDFLSALERWVEQGEAPDSLVAWRTRNAVPTFVRQPRFPLAPASIEYERRLFPWPAVAIHDGKGDAHSAASFIRREPGAEHFD